MDLEQRVAAALASFGIDEEEPLGVACSGGADSIALTHMLARARDGVVVLHVDHGLRADSADDAAFVRVTAHRLGIRLMSTRVTFTPSGAGVEADARVARYAALERMAAEAGIRFVATAHTLDDQAETVLLRSMRGGGLDAIAPMRGMFIRPLLGLRRDDLRAWLRNEGLEWREDPTNADLRFERNWVRSVLLPAMEQRRPGAAASLATIARRRREDRDALDAFASDVFARAAVDDVGVFLSADDLDLVPPAISLRVIRTAFRRLGVDPSQDVVESVRARRQRRLRCASVDVWRLDDGIAFTGAAELRVDAVEVPPSGRVESSDWGIRVRVGASSAAPGPWRTAVPDGTTTITIRGRRPGDRVETAAGHKKIQDVLVDAKVPRPFRGLVPVLDIDGGAYAVVGYGGCRRPATASGTVIDVEPFRATWSRERAWMGR